MGFHIQAKTDGVNASGQAQLYVDQMVAWSPGMENVIRMGIGDVLRVHGYTTQGVQTTWIIEVSYDGGANWAEVMRIAAEEGTNNTMLKEPLEISFPTHLTLVRIRYQQPSAGEAVLTLYAEIA